MDVRDQNFHDQFDEKRFDVAAVGSKHHRKAKRAWSEPLIVKLAASKSSGPEF